MAEKQQYEPLPLHDSNEQAAVKAAPAPIVPRWKVAVPVAVLFVILIHLGGGAGLFNCDKHGKHGDFGLKTHEHALYGGQSLGAQAWHHGDKHGKHGKHHEHHGEAHWAAHPLAGAGAAWQLADAPNAVVSALGEASCPKQPGALNVGDNWDPVEDGAFGKLAADRLSRSVQINTVSFDTLPQDPKDPAFDGHYKFAEFLEKDFPTIYEKLNHEMVNTHGHLFTWEGKNKDLKPIMLMAHIDTVPVNPETEDQWAYPAWSGEITTDVKDAPGTWIWGRGASDCKNSIMGILGSVEKLISEGFEPERTVLIAYGFDEEIGGARGAMPIANLIEERFGKDGVAFIIDEGFSGVSDTYGARIASLGMAEKGSVSVVLKVNTPGGHASVAPVHTGIGYMSALLKSLEDHPFKPSMEPASPFLKYLSCLAEYAPEFPKKLRKAIQNPKAWPKLAKKMAKEDRIYNSFLATTAAIDLINGGVKINALPETVTASVNHRISFTSSVNATLAHYLKAVVPAAHKLGLTVDAFGHGDKKQSNRHLSLSIIGNEHAHGLEPAPITPSDTPAFAVIGGTIKAIWGDETVISPTGMFANTDTARTWALTKNIYRFTPARMEETLNQHTVDERISLNAHLTTTRFYYKLIRNTDGWQD